jgi:GT2 family glycosyltransferase
MSHFDISAVIVTYESEAVLRPCLEALKASVKEMIVVDNASTDKTVSIAQEMGAKIIQAGCNLGYGRANNLGAAEASYDWLLIINPDCRLPADNLSKFLELMKKQPDVGAIAPILEEKDGRIMRRTQSHLDHHRPLEGSDKVSSLSGACFLCSKAVFNIVGGFDPAIFLFYEDDDFFRKIRLNGYRLILLESAKAFHDRGQSSSVSLDTVFLSRYHQAWSRCYVEKKYGIRSQASQIIIQNGLKWLLSCIGFQTKRMARYGGSFCGALDFALQIPRRNP